MSQIRCHNLSFEVAGKSLLSKVNAQFTSGKINVILGQNGAGKSTLLRLLAKTHVLSAGQIVWQGKDLSEVSLSSLALQRAVVEQQQSLQFDFSVRQLVSLGLEVQFGSELVDAYEYRAQQSLDFEAVLGKILRTCDLTAFAERSVLSLSGGEFKRAQIARAIAQIWPINTDKDATPDFTGRWLFLDEWNAALDMRHQQCFASLLRSWAAQGLGVVMVLHDLPLAMQLADSVVLLKQGKVFAQGDAQDVMTQTVLQEGLEMQLQSLTSEQGQRILLPKFY